MGVLRKCLFLLPLILLSGCLEYEETIRVNADKSGGLKMDLSVLDEMLEEEEVEEIRESLAQTARELNRMKEVKKATSSDFLTGDMHHFVLDIVLKDYRFVGTLMDRPFAGPRTDGMIRFEELKNGNIAFTRVLDPDRAERSFMTRVRNLQMLGKELDNLTRRLDDDPFKDKYMTFKLIAPRILKAPDGKVKGNTAIWKFPIHPDMDPEDIPPVLKAEFSMTPSSAWMLLAGGLLVLVIGSVWFRSIWRRGILRRTLARYKVI